MAALGEGGTHAANRIAGNGNVRLDSGGIGFKLIRRIDAVNKLMTGIGRGTPNQFRINNIKRRALIYHDAEEHIVFT